MKGRSMNYRARVKMIKGQKIDLNCYRSTVAGILQGDRRSSLTAQGEKDMSLFKSFVTVCSNMKWEFVSASDVSLPGRIAMPPGQRK